MDPFAIIAKGQRAHELLNNETLIEALADLEADAVARWRDSPARDIDGREALYAHVQGIDALRASLTAWADRAKHEADKLEKQQRRDADKAARRPRFGIV